MFCLQDDSSDISVIKEIINPSRSVTASLVHTDDCNTANSRDTDTEVSLKKAKPETVQKRGKVSIIFHCIKLILETK